MYDGGQEQSRKHADGISDIGGTMADDAFGRWLGRSLHESFAAVAAEPVPEDLLRLVEAAACGQRGP